MWTPAESKVKPKPRVLMFRRGGQRPNVLLGAESCDAGWEKQNKMQQLIWQLCYVLMRLNLISLLFHLNVEDQSTSNRQNRINAGEKQRKESHMFPAFSPSIPPPELCFDAEFVYWEIATPPHHSAVCHIHWTLPDCRRGNNRKHFLSWTQTVSMETKIFISAIYNPQTGACSQHASLFKQNRKNQQTLEGFTVKTFSWEPLLRSVAKRMSLKADGSRINWVLTHGNLLWCKCDCGIVVCISGLWFQLWPHV